MCLNKKVEAAAIKKIAAEVGFDLCGITRAHNFDAERRFFGEWLARGMHGGLGYLERNADKRFDASLLVPGARSIIVCAVSYKNAFSLPGKGRVGEDGCPQNDLQEGGCLQKDSQKEGGCPQVASYALSTDYHVTVRQMLHEAARRMQQVFGDFSYRAFVDTAPIAEKVVAADAGLGFIGRNKLLISPRLGSYMFLGEIVTELEPDAFDVPYEGAGCGECRRCEEGCPAQALTPSGLDARRCISRLTVEPRADFYECREAAQGCPAETSEDKAAAKECCAERQSAARYGGWIFGCDECQRVCPYNQSAPAFSNRLFEPLFDPQRFSRRWWLELSEDEFRRLFGETPVARSNLRRIKQIIRQEP